MALFHSGERGKPTLKIASDFFFHWINITKLTNQMLCKTYVNKKGDNFNNSTNFKYDYMHNDMNFFSSESQRTCE